MANPQDELIWQEFRGLADSLWSGAKSSFYKMRGIDIHSQPGSITVNQKLTKDSASVIDGLCRVSLVLTTGIRLWFSYDSGKIWAESSGTYTLVYTTSPGAGTARCSGAAEFNGFVYWATQSRLHRIATSNATAVASSWTTNAVPNWQTFSATDAEFHPTVVQNAQLFIGDANLIASVDSSATFTASDLNMVAPLRAKCITPFDVDIVIGTINDDNVNFCYIVRWDTVQTSWQFAEPVDENGVNSFARLGTVTIANAGQAGAWYWYDGQFLRDYLQIPGTWLPTQRAEVYPGSTAVLKKRVVFGLSNLAGNPADQGIYTIGRYSKDYPYVLSGVDYVISEDVVATIEIGALAVDGQDLFVAWKNGSTYGVDKLDYSNKYASAFVETTRITPDVRNITAFWRFWANYQSLPASTGLTFKYKKNNDSSYTELTELDDTIMAQLYAELTIEEARAIQMRVEFTVSSNDAPVIEHLGISKAN